MKPNQHWRLFCVMTTWWTLFFIVGLPWDYYLQTPVWMIAIFGIIFPAAIMMRFAYRLSIRKPTSAMQNVFWIAFYGTAPLFVYDYLYLAIHQARGLAFLKSHWYLTVFYVLPWLVLPPIAVIAGRGNYTSSSDHS